MFLQQAPECVTAHASTDDLVVENSAAAGITIGHGSQVGTAAGTMEFQILGTSAAVDAGALIGLWSNDANGGALQFVKSRNTTIGSSTIIQDDDQIGLIAFYGDDGADFMSAGASIAAYVDGTPGSNDMPGRLVFSTTADGAAGVTNRMLIDSAGDMCMCGGRIITKYPTADDRYTGPFIWDDLAGEGDQIALYASGAGSSLTAHYGSNSNVHLAFMTNATDRMVINTDGDIGIGTATPSTLLTVQGNACITGSVTKGSGSFSIDHPLESKKDTHMLVHSFIEGPQADLIYRGVIELTDGSAEINVDTVSGMTEGTFVALNRCVQAFTNNESNWDNVRGSVTGNTLTIESNVSTSTASISWMVIGERCDEHMMDTDWTDDDGKVIVEPIRPEESEESEEPEE